MEKKISLLMLLGFLLAIPSSFLVPDIVVSSKVFGDLFISILKLFVPFIIFISISYSIASFDTNTNLKKMIPLTLILYVISTIISISFSLTISTQINFPMNEALISELNFNNYERLDVKDSIKPLGFDISEFPTLILDRNPLAIMILAIFFGIIIKIIKNFKIINILKKLNNFVLSSVLYFMWFAPLAIFSLFGNLLVSIDYNILFLLLKFTLVAITIFISYFLLFYGSIIQLLLKENFYKFFKNIKNTIFFAFVSSSSSATIPLTLKTAEKNLKIDNKICNFVIPIGATVNMDGSAIYLGLSAVFVSSLIGLSLSFDEYLLILITATIGSIGAAGVPSVALVMMTVVFTSVGIPLEAISLIVGVDRLLDMFRTALNVTGDLVITKIVNRFC
tara:strand:+ start:61134 stop:62309 length:1176 start_codon:yes stop_codon:yes gene_type:complete